MKKLIVLASSILMSTALLVGCNKEPSAPTYTITFKNYDETLLDTITVKQGEVPKYDIELPKRESVNGYSYTFKRWLPNLTAAVSDATYIACFEEKLADFTITFDSDGGTSVNDQTIKYGDKIAKPNNPIKNNTEDYQYTFLYWYDVNEGSDSPFNFNKKITKDFNLKAKWLEDTIKYSVTFSTGGGTYISPQFVGKNQKATVPQDPTKEPSLEFIYTFDGWYLTEDCSGAKYDFSSTVSKDIVLYAKWSQSIRYYTVNFYNGKTLLKTISCKYNQVAVFGGSDPIKSEDDDGVYNFKGWSPNINYPITGDTDFQAVFNTTYKYDHYLAGDGSCKVYKNKEFWVKHADQRDFYLKKPTDGVIVEKGIPDGEYITSIYNQNPNDSRLNGLGGHNFNADTHICSFCNCVNLTSTAFVLDEHHILENDTSHKIKDLTFVKMNKLSHLDYQGKPLFISNAFTNQPLEDIVSIKFMLISGGNYFFFQASNGYKYGFRGGDGATIYADKQKDNSWLITCGEEDNGFEVYDGINNTWISKGIDYSTYQRSFTIDFAVNLNDLFVTSAWTDYIFISDIIATPVLPHDHEFGDLIPEVKPEGCLKDGHIAYYECAICGALKNEKGEIVQNVTIPAAHVYDEHNHCSYCDKTNLMTVDNLINPEDAVRDTTTSLKAPGKLLEIYHVHDALGTGQEVGDASHTLFRRTCSVNGFNKIEFAIKNAPGCDVGIQIPTNKYTLYYLPKPSSEWVTITCIKSSDGIWTMTNDAGSWVENGTKKTYTAITGECGTNGAINGFLLLRSSANFIISEVLASTIH